MSFVLSARRGVHVDISREVFEGRTPLSHEEEAYFEEFDLIYRCLCTILYNYVPTSGHPGGSISSGRIVSSLLFSSMDYDVSDPDREDADIISYAAGHKALGIYAMWALRNEVLRLGAPDLLPADEKQQLRLEDLLGFRRNPVTQTPLFLKFRAKPLDGHPTPATPFIRLSTGASGVGVSTSLGLALGARDYFGKTSPRVHIVEGEGGLTPGRVGEALAMAGTASLDNAFLHIDWNQASIDSNHVCREGDTPGDYVQWDPVEYAYLHDWNVIFVPDGKDYQQVMAAQQKALSLDNGQPTAIVYRTVKGWLYGIEGRLSHGAGHKLCSEGFFEALQPLLGSREASLPTCCELEENRCAGPDGPAVAEDCFWQALTIMRDEIERRQPLVEFLSGLLQQSRSRLEEHGRSARENAPRVDEVFLAAEREGSTIPDELKLQPGTSTTLRGELGRVMGYYNQVSGGAVLVGAADLLDSTSVSKAAGAFPEGYFHAHNNPAARKLSVGGICEDAMSGIMSGLSSFGHHLGMASSYGAFIAPLGHISVRLHAIGNQAQEEKDQRPYRPTFLVCAHAGLKTGEDGPTHADPQALQLLQENFPARTAITLTPWDPQELWPLVSAALLRRPAVIAPFVTRPGEIVPDREKLRLPPATESATGVYALRRSQGSGDGTLVLQGSDVAMAFVYDVLPRLDEEGIDLNVYYVASAELFNALPVAEQLKIFPAEHAGEAMGITGFTLPTMYRWIRSERGRELTLHPFQKGHFLGSGPGHMVLREAGLDGEGQYQAILRYVKQAVVS